MMREYKNKIMRAALMLLLFFFTASIYNVEAIASGNNSKPTAIPITIGNTVNGAIDDSDAPCIDYYKMEITDSGIYNFSGVTHIHFNTRLSVGVLGAANSLQSSKPDWDQTTKSGTWNMDVALSRGTYYVGVHDDTNSFGTYSFVVTEKKSANETVPNTYEDRNQGFSTAFPIKTGVVINGLIATNESADYFKFTIDDPGKYVISGKCETGFNSTLSLYGNSKTSSMAYAKPDWDPTTKSGPWKINVMLEKGTYWVRVYGIEQGIYSFEVAKEAIVLQKPALKKLVAGKKNITVKWKNTTDDITGYRIQYSTSKAFADKNTKTIVINNRSVLSKKIKKLKPKKKYYVRIQTYLNTGNTIVYSEWSKTKGVKTKK